MTAIRHRAGQQARRYLPFARSSLQNCLQYRTNFLVSMATTATSAGVVVFLWRAVYHDDPAAAPGGFGVSGLTTYLLVAQLLTLLHANRVDTEVAQDISRGDIAISLIRPVSYPLMRFFTAMPVVLVNTGVMAVPLLIVFAVLFPLRWPTVANAALFGLALIPSIMIAFTVNLLAGMTGLLTTNTWGIRILKDSAVAFLAGQLVPLDLLPGPIRAVASALPFQAMVYVPLRLLLGRYGDAGEALRLLAGQLVWALLLAGACRWLWRIAVPRIEVLGG